ncbi:predicted protein [Nematostella vectensis]|uniref:Uncharacterized protein n=1 Tax=Nematostella vectensis TaxID=45351 RepID=A7S650_NEMVE|nr:predicted protein [Nematostella vectensis]|eukprot:XP_001632821.1 predicted protein [Nematostella vectensis]
MCIFYVHVARCDQIRRRGTCAAESKFADNKCLKSCNKCKSDCRPCTDAQYSLHYKIEGFRVRAEVGTFHRWPKLAVALKEDLGKLKKVVPRPAALRLQHLSGIYVSKLKVCNTYPTCNDPTVADSYHVSRRWLAMNHDAPEKAGFVDMMNPGEYLVRRSNMTMFMIVVFKIVLVVLDGDWSGGDGRVKMVIVMVGLWMVVVVVVVDGDGGGGLDGGGDDGGDGQTDRFF